jgi:adenylyltransferase/sulfurtransferase
VAIIGCGALGTASAEMLVRAGVGTIHIVDRDVVERSNLQRQQLFTEADAEAMVPKVVAAERRLHAIRTDAALYTYFEHVDGVLMEELAAQVDVIIDATDNFETRLLINDAAHKYGIPWIYGACVGSTGTMFPFVPGEAACFHCLMPTLPRMNETCDTAGIIAPAVQVTASHQCTEVLKWLTGNREAMRKKVLHFDLWNPAQLETGISRLRDPHCETCGIHPTFPSLSIQDTRRVAVLCGRDAVQITADPDRSLSLDDVEQLAEKIGNPCTPYFVEMYAEGHRMILFRTGRLLIYGISDATEGMNLFHKLFG